MDKNIEFKFGLGLAYYGLGNYNRALEGNVYYSQGLINKSIDCHELGLQLAEEIADRRGETVSLKTFKPRLDVGLFTYNMSV